MRVVAISADPPDTNREHCRRMGFTFPFLSDTKLEAIRSYDLVHAGAGPAGSDIARPAEFLIDSTGTVRWVNLSDSIAVRARAGDVLKALDDLRIAPATGH